MRTAHTIVQSLRYDRSFKGLPTGLKQCVEPTASGPFASAGFWLAAAACMLLWAVVGAALLAWLD